MEDDWYEKEVAATNARLDLIRAACTKLIQELREGTGDYDRDRSTGYDVELVRLIQSHYVS